MNVAVVRHIRSHSLYLYNLYPPERLKSFSRAGIQKHFMIYNGTARAQELKRELQERVPSGIPRFVVVSVAADATAERYINRKKEFGEQLGIMVEHTALPDDTDKETFQTALQEICNESSVGGIVVQLPLPPHLTSVPLTLIPPEKDPDALGENPIVAPPVVCAVKDIIEEHAVSLAGNVVVIGDGKLVGAPIARWLRDVLPDPEKLTILTRDSNNIREVVGAADLIISGAGSPGLITPDMIKEGVVLIDAGTSESAGKIAGDADPACAQMCALFTPVPGGVGPLTIAFLFKNFLDLLNPVK